MIPQRSRLLALVLGSQLGAAAAASLVVGLWLDAGPGQIALGALAAAPLAVLTGLILIHPLHRILRAISDGLLGLRERDYGLRIAAEGPDALGELVARFNDLGRVLKSDRSDAYQREILLRTVVESAPVAIIIIDEAGVVGLANDAARDMLPTGAKMEGQVFDRVMSHCSGDLRSALESSADAIYSVTRGGEVETYHVSRRYFDLNTQRHMLLVVKPLTRELVRQEIEIWKKTIRVIGHELNNSLAPIRSLAHSARLIIDRPEHTHRLGAIFDTIQERAEHLERFLVGYTQFARLPHPVQEEVDWGRFLERLRPLYPFAIPGAPSGVLGKGWFDPVQLEQVLINLLKNAEESGGPIEEVRLTVEPRTGGVEVSVLDRGAGMSDEVLPQALLPFFTTKATGSGLGLPLAREIVEGHGGRLGIERREGGGMRVRIELPAKPEAVASPPRAPTLSQ